MKSFRAIVVLICLLSLPLTSLAQPPYPIIFVHGLVGSDESFAQTLQYLGGQNSNIFWGDSINVFDILLNADDDETTALLANDVAWIDFTPSYGGTVELGRRRWNSITGPDNPGNYVHQWLNSSHLFAVNFKEERIEGTTYLFNNHFDFSNSSAIYKQGYALQTMIQEVLQFTGAEKVILVGHSMGGLAIREYLQRTDGADHTWWQDQTPDGHKVAKVVTIGTPHLGSNLVNILRENFPPNLNSEAVRDLRYGYNPLSWAPDTFLDIGVYLFGGTEQFVAQFGLGYHNNDLNCDGDETDLIVGLNSGDTNGEPNPAMSLSPNIDYTWITSLQPPGNGDLIVRLDRQWLYNIGDTLLTDRAHWNEGADYYSIIRGLDEPADTALAYSIRENTPIQGFITFQPSVAVEDTDSYSFFVDVNSDVTITIDGALSGVQSIEIVDAGGFIAGSSIASFPFDLSVRLSTGNYFVLIAGVATATTWEHPYTLSYDAIVVPGTPPDPVDDLIIRLYIPAGEAILHWSPVPSASNYNVYSGLTPDFDLNAETYLTTTFDFLDTTFTHSGILFEDEKRFYVVRSNSSYDVGTMVLVPAGPYEMGATYQSPYSLPIHTVNVPAFYIDIYEVTNAQYRAFCDATGHADPPDPNFPGMSNYFRNPDYSNYPVVKVNWYEAREYAEWAGKRLPTEAEWERAAKGDADNRQWPWGDSWIAANANIGSNPADGYTYTAPVGTYPNGISPAGCYDMAGNVWEWCEDDWHSSYNGAPSDGSAWIDDPRGSSRVLRGGSWYNNYTYARCASRYIGIPTFQIVSFGFRCARTP